VSDIRDVFFIVCTLLLLLGLGITGWDNLTVTPRVCNDVLIYSAGCQAQVSKTVFFTVIELAAYLTVSVFLLYGGRKFKA
jgi:hypothetical protein